MRNKPHPGLDQKGSNKIMKTVIKTIIAVISITLAQGTGFAGGFNLQKMTAGNMKASGDPDLRRVAMAGADDRLEPGDASAVQRKLAESTVAMFKSNELTIRADGSAYITRPTMLENRLFLYSDRPERFSEQVANAAGSGALVGDDLVLTAGHMFPPVTGTSCEDWIYVFGYALKGDGKVATDFPAKDVYRCQEVIAQRLQYGRANFLRFYGRTTEYPIEFTDEGTVDGPDYALIRLTRKVKNRAPLAIKRTPAKTGDKVFMIGYPSSLPVKVIGNGSVASISARGFLTTDLDSFSGSSGSPVFDAATLKITGVHVRGNPDYKDGHFVRDSQAAAWSEETHSSEFQQLIPVTEMEKGIDANLNGTYHALRPGSGGALVPAVYYPSPALPGNPAQGI